MSMPTGPPHGEPLVPDDGTGPERRGTFGVPILLLIPAMGVLLLVIVWPAVKTVYDSFIDGGQFAGVSHYRNALSDPQLPTDLLNTAIWAVIDPVLLTVVGYVLAVLSRHVREHVVVTVVLIPMALPMVVTGTVFRLLYDPFPDRGPAAALAHTFAGWLGIDQSSVPPLLGPKLVTWALISAFIWAWVGLAVVVFRVAMDDIPPGLEDAVRAEGAGSLRVLRDVQWPFLRRVSTMLIAIFAVVASRTFDLVLVMAPGSVQDEAEPLALYLLRQPGVDAPGEAAAAGAIWLLLVVVGSIHTARSARHDEPRPVSSAVHEQPRQRPRRQPTTRATRRPGRAAAIARVARRTALGVAVAWWAAPVVLLMLTSLHARFDQATQGWRAPFSTTSYTELSHKPELSGALFSTAALALVVTVVVVAAAALAARAASAYRKGSPGSKLVAVVFIAAAVVPIQVIARQLNTIFGILGLHSTFLMLALVHIGRGIPFAFLVLRNFFAADPVDHPRQARLRMDNALKALGRVVTPEARPAIIAVAAFVFILVWNDMVVSLLFGGPGFTPVGMMLFGQGREFVTNASVVAAASVVVSAVPLFVLLASRHWILAALDSGVVRHYPQGA
jgi:alpha-glucoside transport system permease protein